MTSSAGINIVANRASQPAEVLHSTMSSGNNVNQQLIALLSEERTETAHEFFDNDNHQVAGLGSGFLRLMTGLSVPGMLKDMFENAILDEGGDVDSDSVRAATSLLRNVVDLEKRVRASFVAHGNRFPSQIWTCCKARCFASIAVDAKKFQVFEELMVIHGHAEKCHAEIENIPFLIDKRRRGVGTSTVAFVSQTRSERLEESSERQETHRQEHLRSFGKFVLEVLPFLKGKESSPSGASCPSLCTEAICCLLGISRNYLYNRKSNRNESIANEVSCLIDSSGVRMRQHRRMGHRINVPPVESLPEFDCGCEIPCFASVPSYALVSEYEEFSKLARELRPRHKENCFLLDHMFDPLSNTSTKKCNKSLAALYNVSEALIADVRRSLDSMCTDCEREDGSTNAEVTPNASALVGRTLLANGTLRYKYDRRHPINRYPESVRERIEGQLDMVLRADPAAANGHTVCRLYNPEINTQDKLRECLLKSLSLEEEEELNLSPSTVRRMILDYLRKRKHEKISFAQSDHNACPNCKYLQLSILQSSHEAANAQRDLEILLRNQADGDAVDEARAAKLRNMIRNKRAQEEECLQEFNVHNGRDMRIRKTIKELCDLFRPVENHFRGLPVHLRNSVTYEWRSHMNRGSISHQDDMTKVDLPHFVVTASADITRWRFDANAHVNAVTNDAIVFSHEQGMASKDSSLIIEEIILEHILTCRGESIKIVVSDNASAGKSWLTTVPFAQYFVDQGLADVFIMAFLENNHGKWLADMMFGQFQTRRKRCTILSVDDMLSCFEGIKKRNGKIQGFALNPLSSVDFAKVFESLGYETECPKDFGFAKRNIHFVAAARQGAKERLPFDLKKVLAPLLPDDEGMVRIQTESPGDRAQCELPYGDRFFDVPAARVSHSRRETREANARRDSSGYRAPMVIPYTQSYMPSGPGFVSTRNAQVVGHNGIEFMKVDGCAELREERRSFVRRAWPESLFRLYSGRTESSEPVPASECAKCAPENWVMRKPVSYFCADEMDWKARYPPRNMLNAKHRKPPRQEEPWVPTATYEEPPFPLNERTSAYNAMRRLSLEHRDVSKPVHVLDVLREVYRDMGDREDVTDIWLQKKATVPSSSAVRRYCDELQVFIERESKSPKAPRSVRQFFKKDPQNAEVVKRKIQESGLTGAQARYKREKLFADLYKEAEESPGALNKYRALADEDLGRYARELCEFREAQKEFDREKGLLPVRIDTG